MPNNFWFSPEGEAEYKKAGLDGYDPTVFDVKYLYEFLPIFKEAKKERKWTIFHSVTRIQSGWKPEEEPVDNEDESLSQYLLWNVTEICYDGNNNRHHFNRSGMGKYPIPEVTRTFKTDENGYPVQSGSKTTGISTGYNQPFDKRWILDMIKKGYIIEKDKDRAKVRSLPLNPRSNTFYTATYLQKEGDRKKVPVSLHDFMNCNDFKMLYRFGHVLNDDEKKAIKKWEADNPGRQYNPADLNPVPGGYRPNISQTPLQ